MQDHCPFVSAERLKLGGEKVQLVGARQRYRIVGQSADGHVFDGLFQARSTGRVLYVHCLRVTGEPIAQPPIVLGRWTYRNTPPLVRDAIRQETIVGLFRDGRAGEADDLRRPSIGERVARNFDQVQLLRRREAVKREVVSKFLDGSRRVSRSDTLVRGLEKDVQVHARFVAFVFLKNAGDDGARETGLIRDEGKRFGG